MIAHAAAQLARTLLVSGSIRAQSGPRSITVNQGSISINQGSESVQYQSVQGGVQGGCLEVDRVGGRLYSVHNSRDGADSLMVKQGTHNAQSPGSIPGRPTKLPLAQGIEHGISNPRVGGSIPSGQANATVVKR